MVLNIPNSISSGILLLTDVQGRTMRKIEVGHDKMVRIGQYLQVEGIYYYTFQDKGTGQRYTGRFIYK